MLRPALLLLSFAISLVPILGLTAPPRLDPAAVNASQLPAPVLKHGDRGAAVLRAQVLLDRQHFSPGEIDGVFGTNVANAVRGLQHSRGLAVTGDLDAATWQALLQDARPVLIQYALTAIDVAGPFFPIPDDMMEKSRLPSLPYASALEALGEKFHTAPELLQQLNPQASFRRAGEMIWVPDISPVRSLPRIARLRVDQSMLTVSLWDEQDRLVAQYPASVGSEHDPLPVGTWTIKGVARNPPFHYNPELFWDAAPDHAKAKLPPGPNSPVGVVWIDLSKDHYGLHGTPEPSLIGKTQSHGCIRLSNWDALRVAANVRPGLPAQLQP